MQSAKRIYIDNLIGQGMPGKKRADINWSLMTIIIVIITIIVAILFFVILRQYLGGIFAE
jgi:hypothetical protein